MHDEQPPVVFESPDTVSVPAEPQPRRRLRWLPHHGTVWSRLSRVIVNGLAVRLHEAGGHAWRITRHGLVVSSLALLALLSAIIGAGAPARGSAAGALIISEVAPWSSGNSPASFAADWFEVTNTGASAVNITGWTMDDSSNGIGASDPKVPLNGITSIAPGESVIFIETKTAGGLAATAATFKTLWFGTSPPAGLQIGSYSGSGVGLSTGGDAVNLFDSTGTRQAKVIFGASPVGPVFPTFDNAAGLDGVLISTLSVFGVNSAFFAANDPAEIGSPGTVLRRLFIPAISLTRGN